MQDNRKPVFRIRHNGQVTPHIVKPLMPYAYDAGLSTTADVPIPAQDITLIINKDKAKSDVTVETIDGDTPFRKLLLASTTIVYAVSGGNLVVSLDAHADAHVREGETLLIERGEGATPKYLKIQLQEGNPSATFILVQVNELSTTATSPNRNSVSAASSQSDLKLGRKGSVLVYDDQPLWALPQDLADKLNASNSLKSGTTKAMQPQPPEVLSAVASPIMMPLQDGGKRLSTILHSFEPSQVYQPPEWSLLDLPKESEVPPPLACDRLKLEDFPIGRVSTAWINMVKQGLSEWIRVPCIIARGVKDPDEIVVGITAALHGNEARIFI
jgi:hypothetical protein